ncbi:MAG TPA: DUF998 domain-containing protein [Candidatus Udaeobacter sp.]|nr:DUF998 domain-containing protein [Candidatus Udaeobacter sp.]
MRLLSAKAGRGLPSAAGTRIVVIGAAAWALSAVYFVNQAIAQAASARLYSLATNVISDLGNTACGHAVCSPLHGFMNATFFAVGLLHVLGAATTHRMWPRPRLSGAGLSALALAGVGLCTVALAPENEAPAIHVAAAAVGLISLNLAMILLGSALLALSRRLGVLLVTAGSLGFIGLGLFVSRTPAVPAGVAERIGDYPAAAMVVVLGIFLLRSLRRERTELSRQRR